jgi:hypothetical protein
VIGTVTSPELAHLAPLAAKQLDDNKVTPGVMGFIVFAVIGLALWYLMKNMNKQFTKVNFEQAPPDPTPKASAEAEDHTETAPADETKTKA